MQDLRGHLDAMIAAATAAGDALTADFRRLDELTVSEKGPADFVSAADLGSQRIIEARLALACPGVAFLGEEDAGSHARGARRGVEGLRFVVDPLDGTTNFLHGIPHFAVAIALEEDGDVVAGVVLDPSRQELFAATRGGGCFLGRPHLGRTPLACSKRTSLEDAVIATGIPHRARGDHPSYLRSLASVMDGVSGIRRLGAAALDLAYVAAGRFDGFFESGLARWDVAAGALLVREAGGRTSELGELAGPGDPVGSGNVLATNGHVHDALNALLRVA